MHTSRERLLSLALLAAVLVVNAAGLWPDLAASRVDLNDNVSHFTLIERMVQAVEHGENPLDCWSPEWSLGYPVLRTYQPLAHALVAAAYFALDKAVPLMTVFVWVRFLSLALLPLSFYASARLMGLAPLTGAAAAMLAPLVSTNSLYGVDYGSYVWAGLGLFPQCVATHLFLLTVGLSFWALRRGRRLALAGLLLGLTFLAHFIYGYMAALTVCLMALMPAAGTPLAVRLRRTLWVGGVAFLVAAFQMAALSADHSLINHSRWEPTWKWDSFGAGQVLKWLFTGQLLDHGRLPVLSLLALAGVAAFLLDVRARRETSLAQRFMPLAAVLWILMFFGRPFWGPLLTLLGISEDVQLHRVIGGAQVFLVLLAAMGLAAVWREVARRWQVAEVVATTALLLYPAVQERYEYLANNAAWGSGNLAAYAAGKEALDAAIANIRNRGGRAYPGLAAGWGGAFKIGDVPFYAFLSRAQVPAVAFLYHSMALTSDIMVRFDERNPAHYRLFNVQSVVAPPWQQSLPPFLALRERVGPFSIFEAPGQGYFDLVDAPYAVHTSRNDFYDVNERWLESGWVEGRVHLWLDLDGNAPAGMPRLAPDAQLPPPPMFPRAGLVLNEERKDEVYRAQVQAERPAFALFKMTWHPKWQALVDGRPVKTAMLSPGFVGVPVAAGLHRIELRYQPGPWRVMLGIAGFLAALLLAAGEGRGHLDRIQAAVAGAVRRIVHEPGSGRARRVPLLPATGGVSLFSSPSRFTVSRPMPGRAAAGT